MPDVTTISAAELTYTGTPGTTIYIRYHNYYEYQSDFQICAYTPSVNMGDITAGETSVTCGTPMTFLDPGGDGNYAVNTYGQYVLCPDTPGQYVTVDFCSGSNFFDTEANFDFLTVLDGDYDSSQIIGQYSGTTIPCTFTSGTPDGCLTFIFQGDYVIDDFGWEATVSCTPTMADNTALYDCSPTNCSGECGQWICQDGLYPTENIGNAVEDLALGTSGCFGAAGEIASRWFYFTVLTDGTIEFSFDGPNGQDYDFAIWGPGENGIPPCPMNTGEAPIRCSFAAVGNTGNPVGLNASVANGEMYEGVEGDGWVDALNVQAGETYAMILNIYMNGNPQPVIDLTIGGSGTLDCTPVFLPVEMHSLRGINQRDKNLISWITATELNNDFFTLERSANGYEWEYAGTIEGAGTSTTPKYYSMFDYQPHFPVTYYRVKQTDFNGDFEYSEVIAVNADRLSGEGLISNVFPNPAGDYTSFTYNGGGVSSSFPLNVRILDDFGHDVLNYNYTETKFGMPIMLNTQGLAGGVYQLVATQGDQTTTRKLVIAK